MQIVLADTWSKFLHFCSWFIWTKSKEIASSPTSNSRAIKRSDPGRKLWASSAEVYWEKKKQMCMLPLSYSWPTLSLYWSLQGNWRESSAEVCHFVFVDNQWTDLPCIPWRRPIPGSRIAAEDRVSAFLGDRLLAIDKTAEEEDQHKKRRTTSHSSCQDTHTGTAARRRLLVDQCPYILHHVLADQNLEIITEKKNCSEQRKKIEIASCNKHTPHLVGLPIHNCFHQFQTSSPIPGASWRPMMIEERR